MIYTKQTYVSGSMCDGKLKLSAAAADETVENAVTELMGDLGIDGIVAKEKYNAMWLIVKNNIRFLRHPAWREEFSVKCFISKHSSVKLNIDTFAVTEGGERLFEARTELCAIDLESGRPRKAESVGFTDDMEHEPLYDLPFTRFPKGSTEPVENVTVRSTSLDYCWHTNNIEYVKFVLNNYSAAFFKTHELRELEIHYSNQSFEGERLDIKKLSDESGDHFFIKRGNDNIASCRLVWEDERQQTTTNLLTELAKGEKTAAEKGWLSEKEADAAIAAQ